VSCSGVRLYVGAPMTVLACQSGVSVPSYQACRTVPAQVNDPLYTHTYAQTTPGSMRQVGTQTRVASVVIGMIVAWVVLAATYLLVDLLVAAIGSRSMEKVQRSLISLVISIVALVAVKALARWQRLRVDGTLVTVSMASLVIVAIVLRSLRGREEGSAE
jgi:hypothetical protein